jgi:hypothetical protein
MHSLDWPTQSLRKATKAIAQDESIYDSDNTAIIDSLCSLRQASGSMLD